MANSRPAQKIVDALLEGNATRADVKRRLHEGTIIILNGSDDQNQDALTQIIRNGGNSPAKAKPEREANPAFSPVKDRFDIQRDGKHWHFSIERDEDGNISGVDVAEV